MFFKLIFTFISQCLVKPTNQLSAKYYDQYSHELFKTCICMYKHIILMDLLFLYIFLIIFFLFYRFI